MELDILKIFVPSCGVDLVFNINSLTPYSRSSIIYDVDYENNSVTVAQPVTNLTENTTFNELHLTTIVRGKNKKIRVGIKCHPVKFLNDYRLANKTTTKAIIIRYMPQIEEVNIRGAFRLPLSTKFQVKGKLVYQSSEYFTPADFAIRDISLNGVGIVIPKKANFPHPLAKMDVSDEINLGMILINLDKTSPIGTVPVKAKIVRINQNYSDSYIFLGCKFITITPETDELLNNFIHSAQIKELQRLSNL